MKGENVVICLFICSFYGYNFAACNYLNLVKENILFTYIVKVALLHFYIFLRKSNIFKKFSV